MTWRRRHTWILLIALALGIAMLVMHLAVAASSA